MLECENSPDVAARALEEVGRCSALKSARTIRPIARRGVCRCGPGAPSNKRLPPRGVRPGERLFGQSGNSEMARPARGAGAVSLRRTSLLPGAWRSEEHTSELQSQFHLVCRLLLEKK